MSSLGEVLVAHAHQIGRLVGSIANALARLNVVPSSWVAGVAVSTRPIVEVLSIVRVVLRVLLAVDQRNSVYIVILMVISILVSSHYKFFFGTL